MASWFGKYDFQGKVTEFSKNSTASDYTRKRKVKEVYCGIRQKVQDGNYTNTKQVSVDGDNKLKSVENFETRQILMDGQNCFFQDVSENSNYVTQYTQVFDNDPCNPQVADLSNLAGFTNADISNSYQGSYLYEIKNNAANTLTTNFPTFLYEYAEISSNLLDTSGAVYDFSGVPLELLIKKKMYRNGPITFGDC